MQQSPEEQRGELASTEFDMRLHQLLKKQNVENNEFNRTQYKDQVLQDISQETFQRLTEQFLRQQKLSHLLNPKSTTPLPASINAGITHLEAHRATVQRIDISSVNATTTSGIAPDRQAAIRSRHPIAPIQPVGVERRSFMQRLRDIFSHRRNH